MQVLRFGIGLLVIFAATANGKPQSKERAQKPQEIPDVQVFNAQYGGNILPDASGPIQAARVTATVRNNTKDRCITGLLWKVVITNSRTHKTAETIYAYTLIGAYPPPKKLVITPGLSADISFFLQRKVHVDAPREVTFSIQDYVYKKFDPGKDKPEIADLYAAGDWPYKTMTEPVEQGSGQKK